MLTVEGPTFFSKPGFTTYYYSTNTRYEATTREKARQIGKEDRLGTNK